MLSVRNKTTNSISQNPLDSDKHHKDFVQKSPNSEAHTFYGPIILDNNQKKLVYLLILKHITYRVEAAGTCSLYTYVHTIARPRPVLNHCSGPLIGPVTPPHHSLFLCS